MMPLTLSSVGETATILRVSGNPDTRQHLADMGFVPGGDVTVVTEIGGNIIVKVKEARIAISKEMAQKIMV